MDGIGVVFTPPVGSLSVLISKVDFDFKSDSLEPAAAEKLLGAVDVEAARSLPIMEKSKPPDRPEKRLPEVELKS